MEIIYYNNKIIKFINDLDLIKSSRVKNSIYLLETYGHLLDMPDSKSLGKGLFELRTQGKIKIRILYIFYNNKVYLVHGFVKKTWKIGTSELKYARRVQNEIISIA